MLKCIVHNGNATGCWLVTLLSFQLSCLVALHITLFELVCVEFLGISTMKCVLVAGCWLVADWSHCTILNDSIWSHCWSLSLLFFISGPGVIPLKHYGKCEVLGKIANMEPEYDEPMYFDPDLLPANICGCWLPRPLGLWYWGGRKVKEVWKADSYIRSGNVWLQRKGGVAECEELPLWAWQISASTSE